MASPATRGSHIGYIPICATRMPPACRDAAIRVSDCRVAAYGILPTPAASRRHNAVTGGYFAGSKIFLAGAFGLQLIFVTLHPETAISGGDKQPPTLRSVNIFNIRIKKWT